MEYTTKYPKTISLHGGSRKSIGIDNAQVEQLHIVVRKSFAELARIFHSEGFTKVKFEHKKPDQIGNGFNLKLKKPWEMHVRLTRMKDEIIGIHAEVEVSRDYLQHLFCQRTPVIYEMSRILKRHGVDHDIWHEKIRERIHGVFDNYRIRLSTPSIPVLAWKPLLFVIGTIGSFYLWKYMHTI